MTSVSLPNGYSIQIRKEEIPKRGRSLFRDYDREQVTYELVDDKGKVTYRLPIPLCSLEEVLIASKTVSDAKAKKDQNQKVKTDFELQIQMDRASSLRKFSPYTRPPGSN